MKARRGVLEGRLGGFEERRKGLAERVAKLKAEAAECEKELQAAKRRGMSDGSTSRERQAELRESLVRLTSQLSSSKAEQRESERDRKSAEALDNLKRLIPGTFGRTFDLCKTTHRKYNAAVTIAMGKAMDAIVVEEEGVAKEGIKYLKAQKCAPETFVPLDSIRAIPERLRRLGGTKRPILDVISVSDKFAPAVQYAVGDTTGERYKVVTLDGTPRRQGGRPLGGTLINKAGLMTGGASHQDAKRANKWNEKEHQLLKARAEEAQRELASLGTADLQLTSSKEKKIKKELADLAAAAKAAEAELRSLEKKRDSRQKEVDALTTKANAVEDAVFADFSKSLNLSSVREYEQRQLVEEQQKEGRVLELQAQYDKLNSRLQFEQRKDLPRAIEKLRAAIAADDAKLKAKRAEQAKIEEKSETLRAQAATTEAELAAAKEEQDAKARKLKKELKSLSDERARLQARQAQLETDIQQLRSSRQRTFQTARLQESFSPTGLVGTGTIEGGAQAEPAGEEQEEALRAAQLDETGAAAELLRVTGEVEGMAPNMKAIEQFEEVQERLHAVEGEWDTSRSAARTVSQRFSAAQRVERFMSCFSHVSKVIDDIYKELTKVEGVPLGGTAFLSLEDPSEPYLHGIKFTAMPPAKRFRDMEQLSGGERTLAALALLFAMHDYRPSPFFVMDEIDAALDNVNVTSVAKFIRARADEGKLQFVVISLKDNFYEKAQGLVGIYRDRKLQGSNTVTLDLDAVEPLPAGA
ncbi:hypothetical protein EMIHUDRAFT_451041 [Emiliania huxleyi CCMP1516]|uniref:SMC hinge domain-containing protein n=2 Tax=Emiliania huxleyi TaxID=2903 RepID=A0A0D3J907_EMIH1|nr:hypothetical protein EMIHUDRAFT_451041 [Emiliania huxleyi CCMP1516]EOD19992.1 hypothetical protein EMIHUDRAFT_451041 [Emiliania huxleyi CCMP1516]|eukprot:XP_005772421.1 hypothetical protein EMIHUDRAFT_451041 [Emiliania huxleyi CCMP1516]